MNTGTAHLPRERWDAFDPILLAEGLFAAANIFSSLKLVYIFSVNPHLGKTLVRERERPSYAARDHHHTRTHDKIRR